VKRAFVSSSELHPPPSPHLRPNFEVDPKDRMVAEEVVHYLPLNWFHPAETNEDKDDEAPVHTAEGFREARHLY